jgi:guanylate kinase
VFGSGGVGKGTLVERLMSADPRLWLSRSWTTRRRRLGEPETAYHFVDREEFLARRKAGGFLESAEFLGHLYGTPTLEAPPGRDVLLEIEVDGAEQVKARHPDAVAVMVVAPSPQVQAKRLRARGDNEDHVAARMAMSPEEEARGRRLADHVVVNDDVDQAASEVVGILEAHRRSR